MIIIENLTKSFGTQLLFRDISFSLGRRERLGLVGRNGHGKTTLFRLIIGEEHPDAGSVTIPKHYRVGHVSQYLHFTRPTLLEEGCLGLPEDQRFEVWQVEKILSGLGFTTSDFNRHPREFSGGYQVRLNLAKTLVSAPHLLLLDEPTNYLDITSIRWLSQFLRTWPNEMMLITHDRSFMDTVTTHILGIHRCKIKKVAGNTEKLYEQIIREEEIHEKTRINDEKKRKEMEIFISRFRAKARLANLVQSRVKALQKKEKLDKLEKVKDLDFDFLYAPMPGKFLLSAEDISFSYDASSSPLIDGFSLSVGRSDRICIIGKNGKGKTTLLKLLAEELTPLSGRINNSPNLRSSCFVQTHTSMLEDQRTVEEEILASDPLGNRERARTISGAMMFEGDHALKKIKVLSGGERSRVLLGKMLVTPSNLLLLDEPTNHLDMQSCDALLEALDSFDGAIIMVTHNEMFLHALANRIIAFDRDSIRVFEGSYQDFLDRIGWEDEEDKTKQATPESATPIRSFNKKDLRKMRSDILARRSQVIKPLENRSRELEEAIAKLEERISAANRLLVEASEKGEGQRITSLSREIHALQEENDACYEELEKVTDQLEKGSRQFDEEIASLEKTAD